jgi:CO/xanthine dehydrogenase Mo-binding subunit
MKSCGFSLGFPEQSEAKVILTGGAEIESATVVTAATDFGQGAHTVLAQIAAETLSISLDKVSLIKSDTGSIGNAGPAAASRITQYAGNAVKFAAEKALEKWRDEERPASGLFNWKAPETASEPGEFPLSQVNSLSYGVHAVEVEVDIETGEITLCHIAAAHDPGKAVNPVLIEGQIEGGIVQAVGWALYENFIVEHCEILTDKLSTYLIPTVLDIPEKITTIIDEEPDPMGPYGVRGIGEITFIPIAPAIISAIHDAVGIWFDSIPVTPERFLKHYHRF